jgi:phosphatidylserine/phosphatidylglycerophosphate/cardiolipin synthase-like enzyme
VVAEARSELLLNVYEFTSVSMAELMASMAMNGTKVKVLVERSPVGGIHDSERYVLAMLTDAGCHVRTVGSNISAGEPGAFGYDHAKYMVIDDGVTVVISENLVPSALNTSSSGSGNRGWGGVVWNMELASHFKGLFEQDWLSGSPYIGSAPEGYTPSNERELVPVPLTEDRVLEGQGDLVPLVSPDGTEDLLLSMIDGTKERLYVEMLSLGMEWENLGNMEPSPVLDAVLEAARRGVEVKLLLDDNFPSTSDNDEVVSYINEIASSEGLDLEARLADIQNISMVHNKGMVADDKVLVSSINWVDTAFRDNREVGLSVELEGLADVFSSYFLQDWVPISNDIDRPVPPTSDQDIETIYPVCGSLLLIGAIVILILGSRASKNE